MEIGGNRCHLCGSGVLYNSTSRLYKKKYRRVEHHIVYECGTQIFSKWREYDGVADGQKLDRHIHAECI